MLDSNHHHLEDYINEFIQETKSQLSAIEQRIVRKEDIVELIPTDDYIQAISLDIAKKEADNLKQ